jgi:hypothetical protein
MALPGRAEGSGGVEVVRRPPVESGSMLPHFNWPVQPGRRLFVSVGGRSGRPSGSGAVLTYPGGGGLVPGLRSATSC